MDETNERGKKGLESRGNRTGILHVTLSRASSDRSQFSRRIYQRNAKLQKC